MVCQTGFSQENGNSFGKSNRGTLVSYEGERSWRKGTYLRYGRVSNAVDSEGLKLSEV